MAIEGEVVLITPQLAEEWLGRNVSNRTPSKRYVEQYAGDMARGKWKLHGSAIQFDEDGNLLDGQQRLLGIIKSGTPTEMFVVRGVPREAFQFIDGGKKRSPGDVLSIMGCPNAKLVASALRLLHDYRLDRFESHKSGKSRPDNHDIGEMYEAHPRMVESARVTKAVRGLLPPSIAAFLHYEFSERDQDLCDDFFECLASGVGLTAGSAALLLRERMKDNKAAKAKLPDMEIVALSIKAWNAWRERRPLQHLRWRTEGPRAESFPEIS